MTSVRARASCAPRSAKVEAPPSRSASSSAAMMTPITKPGLEAARLDAHGSSLSRKWRQHSRSRPGPLDPAALSAGRAAR